MFKRYFYLTIALSILLSASVWAQAPSLDSPADGTINMSLTPEFVWQNNGSTNDYYLRVTTDDANWNVPPGGNLVINKVVNGATNHQVDASSFIPATSMTEFDPFTTYWWRVNTWGDGSEVSAEWSFTTGGVPMLSAPSNGSTEISLTPMLKWTYGGDVASTSFKVEVDDNSDFSSLVIDETVAGVAEFTPASALDANTEYFWRVYPVGHNPEFLSAEWSFTTGEPPALVAPANNSLHMSVTPTFEWTYAGSTTDYTLQVSTSAAFTPGPGIVFEENNINGFTATIPGGSELDDNTYYYWRVLTEGTQVFTSDSWRFKTVKNLIPQIGAPLNHADVYTDTALLTWYFNQPWTGFEFEVRWSSTDPTLATYTSIPGLTGLTHSLNVSGGLTYYWQVVAIHSGTGAVAGTSVISEFHTKGAGNALEPIPSYPLNGHVVYTHAPTLYWYVNGYAAGINYKVEVKLTSESLWSSADEYNTTDLYLALSGLLPEESYDWRVTAEGTNGDFTSDPQTFTTSEFPTVGGGGGGGGGGVGTPGAPTPMLPLDGYVTLSNTPTLYWFLSGNPIGLSFEIEIDTDPVNLTGAPDYAGITNMWFEIPAPLFDDYDYYWTVRWHDGTDWSDWSDPAHFKTPPAVPPVEVVQTYPKDGVTVYTNAPFLFWYTTGLSTGLSFDVQVKASGDAWGAAVVNESTSNYFLQATGLTGGTTYEWRVSADGGTTWTTEETFTVNGASGALPVPVLDYPLDGSDVYVNNPLIVWHIEGAAIGATYELQYRIQGDPWGASIPVSNTFYQMPELTPGVTYEWQVRTVSGGSLSSGWASGSFSIYDGTGGAVPIPKIAYPLNAGTVYVTNPFLIWYVTAPAIGATYTLEYATSSDFTSGYEELTGIDNIFKQISNLIPGQTYWWKVKTVIGATESTWSSTYSFTVEGSAISPVIPAVGGPSGGSLVADLNPEISWFSPAPNKSAVTYELQYATNRDMIDATVVDGLESFSQKIEGLEPGTTYFWIVRAIDAEGHSSGYSEVASFKTTGEVTGVEEKEEVAALPEDYALEQNYPNPFNPTTNINFALPEAGMVSLRIYNILGQEVATLLNESMPAGFHTVRFDAASLSTGVYIYRIDAGKFTSMKKMVLMK